MNDPCVMCPETSTGASPFCYGHESGWVKSEERKLVDFNSEDSYRWAIGAYVERLNAPTIDQSNDAE